MNKAFDFRTRCETFIRMTAHATGWYEQRESAQFFLALILPAGAGLFLLILLRTKARQFVRDHPLALSAWFLLFLYFALRQAQEWKPALDWLAFVKYHDWRLALEVGGIGLGMGAVLSARTRKRQNSGPENSRGKRKA